jgi:hypothetical protein
LYFENELFYLLISNHVLLL